MTTSANPPVTALLNSDFALHSSLRILQQADLRSIHRELPKPTSDEEPRIKLFSNDRSNGKSTIQNTYESQIGTSTMQVAAEVMTVLESQTSKVQILLHTSLTFRGMGIQVVDREKRVCHPALALVGERYAVDADLCFIANHAEPTETFPTKAGVFRMSTRSTGILNTDFAGQVCLDRKDPARVLVILMLVVAEVNSPPQDVMAYCGTLPSIPWVRKYMLSAGFTAFGPGLLRELFAAYLSKMSPEDASAAEADPRHFIAGYVQALASYHLDALHVFETSSEFNGNTNSGKPSLSTSENPFRRFDTKLREVTYLEERAQAFFEDMDRLPVLQNLGYLRRRYERADEFLRTQASYVASRASLMDSQLSIKLSEDGLAQNATVKKLTQLAFVFIPLSFVTSIFGMNVDVLSGDGAKWWTVVVGAAVVYALLGVVGVTMWFFSRPMRRSVSTKPHASNRLEELQPPTNLSRQYTWARDD